MSDERVVSAARALEAAKLAFARVSDRFVQLFAWSRMGCRSGDIHDRESLVDWLEADLRYGSGRNEAIFFIEAWRCAMEDDRAEVI